MLLHTICTFSLLVFTVWILCCEDEKRFLTLTFRTVEFSKLYCVQKWEYRLKLLKKLFYQDYGKGHFYPSGLNYLKFKISDLKSLRFDTDSAFYFPFPFLSRERFLMPLTRYSPNILIEVLVSIEYLSLSIILMCVCHIVKF